MPSSLQMPLERTQDTVSLAPTSPTLPKPHSGFLFNTPETDHIILPLI